MGYIISSQGGDEDGSQRLPIDFCYPRLWLGHEVVQPVLPPKPLLESEQGLLSYGGGGDADGDGDDVDGGDDGQAPQVDVVLGCLCAWC